MLGQTAERSERKMNDYIRICEVEKYYGNAANVTKAVDCLLYTSDAADD